MKNEHGKPNDNDVPRVADIERELVTQQEYFLSPNAARQLDKFLFKRILVVFPVLGLLGLLGLNAYLQTSIENIESNVEQKLLNSEKLQVQADKRNRRLSNSRRPPLNRTESLAKCPIF